ncbi:MAG: hypothetical protein FK734_05900 [Asgard group archaeon]|nr:hypothetical protein [Asgard group archaeon]
MKKEKILRISHYGIILGIFLFVILISLSMYFYAGGTWIDPNTERYILSKNLFSDLGRRTTFLGASNIISSVLFSTAIVIIGLSGVVFFLILVPHFTYDKVTKGFNLAGSIFGVLGALVITSIAFVPIDIWEGTHLILIVTLFTLLIASAALYSIAIIFQPNYPNFYGWVFLTFMVCLICFFILINYQYFEVFLEHLTMRAISQEAVVCVGLVTFLIQTIGLLRQTNKEMKN